MHIISLFYIVTIYVIIATCCGYPCNSKRTSSCKLLSRIMITIIRNCSCILIIILSVVVAITVATNITVVNDLM